ncbi:recombinase family protein [Kribbella sp. NPDC059898]|uniref:recombinase family protein n=1 Tax=Kribbella sp. NPDC059898 TaxID=3346995 RepID=UPI0036516346
MLIGYARCSIDKQDLEANRQMLLELGVEVEHIYLDKAYSGTTRARPGLDQSLAAVRAGDSLAARSVRLQLGTMVFDPTDPMGKMFVNILATFAEFEVELLRMRTREGMAIAGAKGKLKGRAPQLSTAW